MRTLYTTIVNVKRRMPKRSFSEVTACTSGDVHEEVKVAKEEDEKAGENAESKSESVASDGVSEGTRMESGSRGVRYRSTVCSSPGCTLSGNYGVPVPKSHTYMKDRKRYCSKHYDKTTMVYLHNSHCKHEGCRKQPTHGFPPNGRCMFCASHKEPGMINLNQYRMNLKKERLMRERIIRELAVEHKSESV